MDGIEDESRETVDARFRLLESLSEMMGSVVVTTSEFHLSTKSLLDETCLNMDDTAERFHS